MILCFNFISLTLLWPFWGFLIRFLLRFYYYKFFKGFKQIIFIIQFKDLIC